MFHSNYLQIVNSLDVLQKIERFALPVCPACFFTGWLLVRFRHFCDFNEKCHSLIQKHKEVEERIYIKTYNNLRILPHSKVDCSVLETTQRLKVIVNMQAGQPETTNPCASWRREQRVQQTSQTIC